jgi:hypothetical protein
MDEKLWAGPALKLEFAEYHFTKMGRSLQPPARTVSNVALEAAGAIIDIGWQRSIYAHLDAFLSVTRSIAEIIQCCFGVDLANPEMRDWYSKLTHDERNQREEFRRQFEPYYKSFRALPLSKVRHIVEHRTGVAPATVTISGMFGVTHIGSPGVPVPISESRTLLAKPHPVRPTWDDFEIDGQPLFRTCQEYLGRAQGLVDEARRIALQVHGTNTLSPPPT